MKKILLVTSTALLLVGCGEKGDFEKAINEKFSKQSICYSFSKENNIAVFDDFRNGIPVKVNIYNNEEDPILTGLKLSGLLTISYEQEMFKRAAILTTTDKGRKTSFWDRDNGACVGHRTVDEITEWTEAGEDGMKIVRVSYTWKLADVPGWVDKDAFSDIKGMAEPEESKIALVKTNKGWSAR
ncbi:DNA-directed RNA polymerase subunit beta [Pectobacterium brasiliense]|uniref:DNA-directed RNA polymerase subunit beta n=1 Tax=Pectobacterium brasiliense TaxID=180957 RepID=UPI0015DF75D9|nr:DNA-directed RNA polymerase subunit beta [Pectobacterium brasiliense]MBA0218801.1 DNA-directed RNA polymerase subunit beta [Pectobacterium brasiliense]MBN3073189.1 DNA-directed RNA polymerase subunit beta [Pectobacterium brasiliense]MBN3170610.1 DNA-directed RNA polymerase subunit beta [Pectobacterium brasiliense]